MGHSIQIIFKSLVVSIYVTELLRYTWLHALQHVRCNCEDRHTCSWRHQLPEHELARDVTTENYRMTTFKRMYIHNVVGQCQLDDTTETDSPTYTQMTFFVCKSSLTYTYMPIHIWMMPINWTIFWNLNVYLFWSGMILQFCFKTLRVISCVVWLHKLAKCK